MVAPDITPLARPLSQKWLSTLVNLAIVVCICAPLLDKTLTKTVAGILLLSAIPLTLFARYLHLPNAGTARLFAWLSTGLLASIVLNITLLDNILNDDGKTGLYSFYLIPLLLLPWLRLSRLNKQWFSLALALIAIISGTQALLEYSYYQVRAGEILHGQPIPFGNLSLCCALLCLLFIHRHNSSIYNAVLSTAVIMGILASLLSLTRGGWIALPAVLLFIALHRLPSLGPRKLITTTILAIGLSAVTLIATEPGKQVQARFTLAYDEAQSYFSENTSSTSVGVRFALWSIAWQGFQEAPLFGQGIASFYEFKQQAIEGENLNPELARFRHPHNEYLELLFSRGIFGTAVFIIYLGVLLILFRRRLLDADLSLCGQTLILCYLIFSLTESFFSLHVSLFFFVVICTILFYLNDNPDKSSEAPTT